MVTLPRFLLNPSRDGGKVGPGVDVGESFRMLKPNAGRADTFQHEPGGWMSPIRQGFSHRVQGAHGPHRAQGLMTFGSLRHGCARARCRNQAIEQVIGQ